MIDKSLVKSRFSKNLSSYNEEAKIQKKMAEKLFSYLSSSKYENILEIGCGTGFLTEFIFNNIEYKNYIANDIVEKCESYINKISQDINFVPEDIEKFLEKGSQTFDLIISNASLQWVENFDELLIKLLNRLTPKGELVVSTFGKENFREIYHLLGTGLNYYSINELKNIFGKDSFTIEEEIYVVSFDSPKDVLRHLKLTGVNAITKKAWTRQDLLNFENGYRKICVTRPTLTYNPIYIKYKIRQ